MSDVGGRLEFTGRPGSQGAEELLGRYFPALDHGFVALVDYMGTDECIERAARVSYGSGTRATSETRTLIRYLRRHLHTTPSEMLELKFHCAMPIFIARQWIRHRTASVNEMSGRYSLMPMLFYTPERAHCLTQSTTNKQGRSERALDDEQYLAAVERWESNRRDDQGNYEWLTSQDVARELARIDLPLSTYTQWYWKIDLHNLLHFLKLRVDPHAQYEFRVFGEIIAAMVRRVAPLSYEAWIDYDVGGEKFSYDEMQAIRSMLMVFAQVKTGDDTARAGAQIDEAHKNLSEREVIEFCKKLEPRERPSFSLDLEDAKTGEYFEKRFAAASPKTTA